MVIMDFFRTYFKRSVCEVTREIFDIIHERKAEIGEEIYNEIFAKLQEQMVMQKKMHTRLQKHYKDNYEQEYKDNTDTDIKMVKRAKAYGELSG